MKTRLTPLPSAAGMYSLTFRYQYQSNGFRKASVISTRPSPAKRSSDAVLSKPWSATGSPASSVPTTANTARVSRYTCASTRCCASRVLWSKKIVCTLPRRRRPIIVVTLCRAYSLSLCKIIFVGKQSPCLPILLVKLLRAKDWD